MKKKLNHSPKNGTDSAIVGLSNKEIAEMAVIEHDKDEAFKQASPDWEKVTTYQDAKCIKSKWVYRL